MENDSSKFHQNQRTEQVQHIIERMPTKFGLWIGLIVTFIFILLLTFGWLAKYPDILQGQITINSNVSPIKLVANSNGKLKLLNVSSMEEVKEGQIIAYIENATSPFAVTKIDSLLDLYNPIKSDIKIIKENLPHDFSIGELNIKYYAFYNALQDLLNYQQDHYYDKQEENLNALIKEQKDAVTTLSNRLEMSKRTLGYAKKFYLRDSILLIQKVISESEFDKAEVNYLNSKDAVQSASNNLIQAKQATQQTVGKIQELSIQNPEKGNQLRIAFISAYNDLKDNIKIWEQKYVFKAPFKGRVQFLKFYTENQFVQSGEQVFTIVPTNDKTYGQVLIPANGSGKLKIGQEVIVKLDNYPYMEFGSLRGKIESISLTTNLEKAENGNIETYLVTVNFPNGLKTNYGKKLDFKFESKGVAEIVTNDRRFIQRLFDNLKYVLEQ
ncbi:HlyD family efflux transporter periplasmic adaptor subunit [Pedobacter sp. SD-b]|uniref:HlyD family efflux transporter periplasmic adaptor subunit n=1 Tax=Pedobacter segetis TaxID=2793069 RepID=A0ABS1BJX0_9SPHI|nr:HlyD family efflux transporter periplasmic adaptor subunit [Pedobacter segetis]MBK0382509.1 HlyD family efflux transporter periplasmic adaptor subunit [Pedobacter segetis]